MDPLHIVVENETTGKGRIFEGTLVGYITCGQLWPQASDNIRPVMAVVACTEAQSRPFIANLQTGRKAKKGAVGAKGGEVVELLKSAGYVYAPQRFDGLVVTTAYLPSFFTMDPGMVDPAGIEFILAPPEVWCEEHRGTLPVQAMTDHVVRTRKADKRLQNKKTVSAEVLASLAPVASLAMAYLDRRTRAPLLQDPRFHLQLLAAMVDAEMVHFPSEERDWGDDWGVASKRWFYVHKPGQMKLGICLAAKTTHTRFQEVLGEQVRLYYKHAKTS